MKKLIRILLFLFIIAIVIGVYFAVRFKNSIETEKACVFVAFHLAEKIEQSRETSPESILLLSRKIAPPNSTLGFIRTDSLGNPVDRWGRVLSIATKFTDVSCTITVVSAGPDGRHGTSDDIPYTYAVAWNPTIVAP